MKRRVISVGVLGVWILLVCTVLSEKIEEMMTVRFVLAKVKETEKDGVFWWTLPSDALAEGENGKVLYKAVRKEGWEEGLRAEELDQMMYQEDGENLLFSSEPYEQHVRYASRQITEGDLLEICVQKTEGEDSLLITDPKGDSLQLKTGEDYRVEETADGAALVVTEGLQPFLESQARSRFEVSDGGRVYSLGDFKQLCRSLPLLAGMAVVLLASLFLWSCCFRMLKDLYRNRFWIAVDTGAGLLLFWLFLKLVGLLSLPYSLLPEKNILDFGHYIGETRAVLGRLEAFSSPLAREMTDVLFWNLAGTAAVTVAGFFVFFGLMYVQRRYRMRKK